MRTLAYRVGLTPFVVWRTLNEQSLHQYHVQCVQHLKSDDLPKRVASCEWLLKKNGENPHFTEEWFSIGEVTFTRDGIFNYHNIHVWSDKNPHAIQETHFQDSFSAKVWAGMVENHLIDPYILPPRLTTAGYLDFLNHILGNFLEDVPLGTRCDMWYLPSSIPAISFCGGTWSTWYIRPSWTQLSR